MSAARPLRFVTFEGGCIVALSHRLTANGYFVKKWGFGAEQIAEPFHRFIYRAHNGESSIPDGWEVDHVCGNRACCNPAHLRVLSRSDHLDITNRMRNAERQEAARLHWEAHGRRLTGEALANALGGGQTTAARWIRTWKAEDADAGLR